MGMSPAPSIANLYIAIHEKQEILSFLDSCVLYLRQFIDDGLAIWLHDPDLAINASNWLRFKQAINAGGLQWTFTKQDSQVDFMDTTKKIIGDKIETTLYEKPLVIKYLANKSDQSAMFCIAIVSLNRWTSGWNH